MATPSSSATSPSPTIAFAPPVLLPPPSADPAEQDHRKRAVEKFKARAEISNVTRSLRARLSYASYKAIHNISHVPLRDLEAQSHAQAQSFSRTMAAKRKAAPNPTTVYTTTIGNNNYYNNPATQGGAPATPSAGAIRRGSMAPPPNMGPRTYYPSALNGAPNATGSGSDLSRPPPAQSLFTSILAPPPFQQARTILNVSDPPLPPPSRPPASPRPRAGKVSARSIAEGTRAMAKTRRDDKPEKRKAKRALEKGKQKQRRHGVDVDADGDVDMKAAATLTSLLLHHRPSIGSASSPRSSLDDSETGSTQSYSHFAQSSARNIGASSTPAPPSNAASTSTAPLPEFRRASATPPPTQPAQQTTPRPAPTDNEAADLMLFLATSPSPVRKDSKDLAAYRALNGAGANLRAKGRVLFPTAGPVSDAALADGAPKHAALGLARGMDSFTSSISSIGSEMAPTRGGSTPAPPGTASRTSTPAPPPVPSPAPPIGTIAAPSTAPSPAPGQLLPPPPLPQPAAVAPPARKEQTTSPKPVYGQAPPPPAAVDFNFNDFLHASPSPARGVGAPGQKQSLGLRADVGRKLFEEEQMRHVMGAQSPGKQRPADERGLGAGIDLVQG
ncbi:hypothetical protein B0H10DRAFT_760914 [Mycena sp. CBHHK59/15]|nr:hypothetical protein B0H10DRAFT_760914 [Mycena sp. CBHHK59/15]